MTAKIIDMNEYRQKRITREIEKLWGQSGALAARQICPPPSLAEIAALEQLFKDVNTAEADRVEVVWQDP